MGIFHALFFFLFLHVQSSHCATLVVDGFTQWSFPKAFIGDTIIFKHKNEYNLYIFRNKESYNNCNFTQATPLSTSNSSTYTWHPSRPGNFYFSFYNGTSKPCLEGQKLAVAIIPNSNSTSTAINPANPPEIATSPVYPWPYQPREKAAGDTADGGDSPALSPGSIPFINSNPAVALPAGEVDSATISPLPTSPNLSPKGVTVSALINHLLILFCVIMVIP
ncbi:hypothetical protein RND81_01G158700 [Saponaria officinalis]|uniref:Phytocyanin domain-containing protein n=1 Tax=Saponaria officinalis TaxID=3572 RepID=A0AAW1NFU1_SAPOF